MNCTDRRLADLARLEATRRRDRRFAAMERAARGGVWWAVAIAVVFGALRWAGAGR